MARNAGNTPRRLEKLERTLLTRVSRSSGGWPHWLDMDDASTSIVGTAHTLAILRMRGYEVHESVIDEGLRYLARAVRLHIKPSQRGGYSRYPAYALWGLMRFPGGLADPEIVGGARFSASWLLKRARPSGGWTVGGQAGYEGQISLPVTMAAVHGLDRLVPFERGSNGERFAAAAAGARRAIAAEAQHKGAGVYWCQNLGGKACAGATSLAVLTLAGGSDEDREVARKGIRYLLDHPKDWTDSVHFDQNRYQPTWRIMSFSLGLRAVLHPCAVNKPGEPVKRRVIEHMDSLWSESSGAWAVEPGADPSTTGSYAAVAALRALKNAWEYDPVFELSDGQIRKLPRTAGEQGKPASRGPMRTRRWIEVWAGQRKIKITEEGPPESEFHVTWDRRAVSQWKTLLALLKHQEQADKARRRGERLSVYEITLSVADLAARSQGGRASPQAVRRTIRRINERIEREAWSLKLRPTQRLIEKIIPGDVEDRDYYGLEETRVTLHPE